MARFFGVGCAVVFLTCCSVQPARAQVQIGFSAGIDKGTQDFLERFPAELRKQLAQLIRDARPEVDASVLTYLKKIDEIIQKNVDLGLKRFSARLLARVLWRRIV